MNIKDKLKTIKISDIKPYKNNTKIHSKAQIESLKQSIQRNEYIQPICVDKNNVIVIGHGRFEAIKQMNGKTIEVVDLSHLKSKEIKKLRILDNKIISDDYDNDLLQAEIENLYNNVQDDIDKIENELAINEKELNDIMPLSETEGDDDIPEKVKAITKMGDLWELGRHRLLAGDSTKESDVKKLIKNKKIDMILTDPPFDLKKDILLKCQNNLKKVCNFAFWFASDKQQIYLINNDFENFNCFFIYKWNFGFCRSSKSAIQKHNLISKFNNKKNTNKFNNLRDNFSTVIEVALDKKIFKWGKSVKLSEEILSHYLQKNNNTLDGFSGYGSFLISCEKLNINYFGIEKEPKYCDLIVKRWINWMKINKKDINIKKNGKKFAF